MKKNNAIIKEEGAFCPYCQKELFYFKNVFQDYLYCLCNDACYDVETGEYIGKGSEPDYEPV
jgi:nitrite reductase/ring-hydroxylating ferredoxin subunit